MRSHTNQVKDREASPEAVVESKLVVDHAEIHIQLEDDLDIDDELKAGKQAVSVLETVEEKALDGPR